MLKSILAVFVGMVTWAVLWLLSNAGLAALLPGSFDADGATSSAGILLVILVLSVVYSVLAGYVTAMIAGRRLIAHTVALGIAQLVVGVLVQLQYWDAMPLWYHLPFLALLLPGNVFGGWLRQQRRAS